MKGLQSVLTILVAGALLLAPALSPLWGQPSAAEAAQGPRELSPEVSASGKVASIDLANGTMTLDTGDQFRLAPSLQFTSFPGIGQEVQVTYVEENGNRVARSVEVEMGIQ